MIEAPDFNTVKKHKTSGSGALCCIVLAPKFHKLGYEGIISRSDYLDERSKESIHFYCAAMERTGTMNMLLTWSRYP